MSRTEGPDLDVLLHALEERASTARTIFMLLDSDADGMVAVEQVSVAECSARHFRAGPRLACNWPARRGSGGRRASLPFLVGRPGPRPLRPGAEASCVVLTFDSK